VFLLQKHVSRAAVPLRQDVELWDMCRKAQPYKRFTLLGKSATAWNNFPLPGTDNRLWFDSGDIDGNFALKKDLKKDLKLCLTFWYDYCYDV
jgi:hypothetical protein